MANPFDQFDAAPAGSPTPPAVAANPFDQFDEPAPRAAASFSERFGDGPMASKLDTSTPEGSAMRRVADEALIGKPSLENQIDAGLFRGANAMGLNLPRNAMAGIEALRSGKSFGQSYREVSDIEDALARQYPKTAAVGTVGGVVGGAVALPAVRAAQGAGLIGRGVANALTGAGYGFASELADTKDLGQAGIAAGIGGLLGGVGGAIIDKAAPVVSRLFAKNASFRTADGALTDEANAALREAGIDPAAITPQLAQHLETTFAAKGPSAAAAREAQAAEFGLPLSRGQATNDPRALALEGRALAGQTGPRAQQIGEDFAARQADAVSGARDRFLGMAAGGAPRIERPQEAFEAVADRARQAAQAEAERASIAQRAQDDALRAVRGRGETDALDGATAAAQGVRDAAAQSRAGYRAAYDDVAAFPHQFDAGALDRFGDRVRGRLGADVPLDDRLTPAASRAIADLDSVPEIFGLTPGQGPNLQQVDQLRKRLVSLYGSTAQNPTDRRALGRVMEEFDNHLSDAAGAGLLNRPAARGTAAEAGDGFPGFAASDATPAPFPAAGGAPARAGDPEGLTRYLARSGGIPLDDEARAADLHRLYVPGNGTLARNGAPTWDQIRVRLNEEGFLPPGMDGAASANDVADWARNAIQAERVGGRATVRMGDEAGIGAQRAADGIADQNAAHADLVDRQARRMAIDLEGFGIGARDLDRAALNDAAEHMVLGRHTDPVDAYEAALTARTGGEVGHTAPAAPEIPFDGATARATSDALPIGDTAPLEAMQRARGLFRQHQQTFKPRGPGDTAGNNLRRIVERDASPNEVARMLFGSTTGQVTSGQTQTLARLRAAVGPDSETWAAVQRGLLARHLGGEGRDLGGRLDYLLSGEGRTLREFLSPQQVGALGRLSATTRQMQAAGLGVPGWVSDLERTGFDPNAIGRSLFGSSGAIGARPGAALEASAVKGFLGPESEEWAMLRQAAVHRLWDPSANAAKTVERLRDFTDGSGSGLAREMFNAKEIGELRRLSGALSAATREGGPKGQEMSGPAAKALAKALDVIAGMVAFKVGGLPAAAGTYGAKVGQRAIMGGVGAASARRSFEGGAPRVLASPPMLPLGRLATGEGLALGQ